MSVLWSRPVLSKGVGDLADAPVELGDGVAARTHSGLTDKALVGQPGNVDIVRGVIEKEWLVPCFAR